MSEQVILAMRRRMWDRVREVCELTDKERTSVNPWPDAGRDEAQTIALALIADALCELVVTKQEVVRNGMLQVERWDMGKP